MVLINKNLEICKKNLQELDDIIVASEDSTESMRRNLIKILKSFFIHIELDKKSDKYIIK